MSRSLATPLSPCDLEKNPISVEIICRAGTNVVGKAWLCWLEMRRDGDVSGDLDEEHVEVVVEVVDEVVEQVVVDVVVVVNVDVDTLGIGTGLLLTGLILSLSLLEEGRTLHPTSYVPGS